MLLLGYSISIFMRVHMSIYAFNTDFNESIYFYDGYTYAIAVIHFLSFSLYIYEHDRLYIWIYITIIPTPPRVRERAVGLLIEPWLKRLLRCR